MTTVIAVIQTKGGTGKTTTSMMLGFALTALDSKVLVLDADKQRSAADWADNIDDALTFDVAIVPSERSFDSTLRNQMNKGFDYIIIDTPPGSNAIVQMAAEKADLVLIPTGGGEMDMSRTRATLQTFEGTDTPVAVVLVNVNKREKVIETALEELSTNAQAALADTVIPTRSATRKAAFNAPAITTKPFQEWMDLATELKNAF